MNNELGKEGARRVSLQWLTETGGDEYAMNKFSKDLVKAQILAMIRGGIYTSPMDRACLRVLAEWCGIEEEIKGEDAE